MYSLSESSMLESAELYTLKEDIQWKSEKKILYTYKGNWSKYWKYCVRNKTSYCVLDLETDKVLLIWLSPIEEQWIVSNTKSCTEFYCV